MDHHSPLRNWTGLRFLFRNTAVYFAMRKRLYSPRLLRDGMEASIELEMFSRPLLYAEERPGSWPILADERRSLLQGDIPMFHHAAESDALLLEGGDQVRNSFGNAGFLRSKSVSKPCRAFLFAGVSGAGKTTISRLAPADVVLLTDEISYVRRREQGIGNREQGIGNREQGRGESERGNTLGAQNNTPRRTDQIESIAPSLFPGPYSLFPAFEAFGTPFAGELARIGENLRAPVAALYLLVQGAGNRFEEVSQAEAARALLQNILFFAQDEELVRLVSQSAFDFVSRVPVRRLVFAPDARVWELII